MPVHVEGFDVSVVKGIHAFDGVRGSASVDLVDHSVTIADPGDVEQVAAAAFAAGFEAKSRLREVSEGNVEPNVTIIDAEDADAPRWKQPPGEPRPADPE